MSEIIFVCDFFVEDIIGGAELTTEAIISKSPFNIKKVKSSNLNLEFISQNKTKNWIFGNFSHLGRDIIIHFIKSQIKYDVLEYDFKFCKFRSPQKHIKIEGSCNCHKEITGKLISLFFHNARNVWFMSKKQRQVITDKFSFLKGEKLHVLSSVFTEENLEHMKNLEVEKNDTYLIFKSDNWLKGTKHSIDYASKNGLKYELVFGLSYDQVISKISKSKGLIFMPQAHDTSSRLTIEAKLLGCELHLNENVLQRDEPWFCNSVEETYNYLKDNCNQFWSSFE